MRIIVFSDEDDEAYGKIEDFNNVEDFKEEIEEQLGCKVSLSNVGVEKCIDTSEEIPGEALIPLSSADITVGYYYVADVEKEEK